MDSGLGASRADAAAEFSAEPEAETAPEAEEVDAIPNMRAAAAMQRTTAPPVTKDTSFSRPLMVDLIFLMSSDNCSSFLHRLVADHSPGEGTADAAALPGPRGVA